MTFAEGILVVGLKWRGFSVGILVEMSIDVVVNESILS